MSPRRLVGLAVLALGSLSGETRAQQIVVRGTLGAPPAAEIALARVAEPTTHRVPAGADPIARVREVCGRATPTYLRLLKAANPAETLSAAPHLRVLTFPACFVVEPPKDETRLPTETLGDFAQRVMGASGPKTLDAILRLNGPMAAAVRPKPTPLKVPYATIPVAYVLRPEAAADPAAAARTVTRALAAPAAALNVVTTANDDLRPMTDVVATVKTGCDESRPSVGADKWPFDAAALIQALKRNQDARQAANLGPAGSVVVAVADNGVDRLLKAEFPAADLAVNPHEIAGNKIDDEGNDFIDDVIGANLFSADFPGPVPIGGVPNPEHGTAMAALALGGLDYRASVGGASPVRLLVISMVERRVQGAANGVNQVTWGYPSKGLAAALRYAQKRGADVLSLSVGTFIALSEFEELARVDSNLVIVAAAGNEATEYDFVQLYPASYGGEGDRAPGRVITVGAHDRRQCLAEFSGRGRSTVDIVAPGVDIVSYGLNGVKETNEGTSQATALVAFTVALLKSEGRSSPTVIRDRLFATADRQPELAEHVLSGGALNIIKAVSVHHDLLEATDLPGLRWVKLDHRLNIQDLCPQVGSASQGRILRIGWRGGSRPLQVLWRASGGKRVELNCKPADEAAQLSFRNEDGSAGSVELSQIASLVPR